MSNKIIVAVSGCPDSMALLDMLQKQGYDCLVMHVNYGVRDSAICDQRIVEDYCSKYNLKLKILNADKVKSGNFQAKARKIRYDFLIELANKYNRKDVYIAHHQDDALETYIMQKRRRITPEYYGIKTNTTYKSINVIRPLLDLSKQDLIDYCKDNNVAYAIDETNLEDGYKRNLIRHQIVDKMNQKDKAAMLAEIKVENKELKKVKTKTENLYSVFEKHKKIDYLLNLNQDYAINVLRLWFKKSHIYNISKLEYLNILAYLKAEQNNEYKINDSYSLIKDYDNLTLLFNEDSQYNFKLNEIINKEYKHFKITNQGTRFEGVTVSEQDFPLTIRNFIEGDVILMRYGRKRVSRWFIDNKIAPSQRRSWPIILNNDNEVILVPGIGCNVTHFSNNPNMFVVK